MFELLYLSYFISDFDQVCYILHDIIRACMSDKKQLTFKANPKVRFSQ